MELLSERRRTILLDLVGGGGNEGGKGMTIEKVYVVDEVMSKLTI